MVEERIRMVEDRIRMNFFLVGTIFASGPHMVRL